MDKTLLSKIWRGKTWGITPPGFHTLVFWVGFWPGSILLLLALPWIWAHRSEPSIRYCVAWAVPVWIAFELTMTKLPHYTLPAYPALAMLSAAWMFSQGQNLGPFWWRALVLAGWTAVTLALCLAPIIVPYLVQNEVFAACLPLCLIAATSLAAAYFLVTTKPVPAVAGLLIAAWALVTAWAGIALPNLSSFFLSERILASVPPIEGCPQPNVVAAGYYEPSMVFLNVGATLFVDDGALAASYMASNPCVQGVIEAGQEQGFLDKAAELGRRAEQLSRVSGYDIANARRATLTLFRLLRD